MNQQLYIADSPSGTSHGAAGESVSPATVIVNADDWGLSSDVTDRILNCLRQGVVSSTSAMVFMADSERAASLASEHNVDTGLHLNLTSPFTGANVPTELMRRQERLAHCLRANRYAPIFFHPFLAGSFEYVVKRQLDEYHRLYGVQPSRIDGHHHMHLSMNVLLQGLLPPRKILRRHFTFLPGEKGWLNRLYRGAQDRTLRRKHWVADGFFNIVPMQPERLSQIMEMARTSLVEIEVHPGLEVEYDFLMSGGLQACAEHVDIARGYWLGKPGHSTALPDRFAEPGKGASSELPHISVCLCTYKRPEMLKRLLGDLDRQRTDGAFGYSIVVADNDEARSGEAAVEEMRPILHVPVRYCAEPSRGIARARNKVIEHSSGDYVALIDDDEFPETDWLLNLLRACRRYNVAGVLGPVKRYLEPEAPAWLRRSSLYDRVVNPTGLEVRWRESRTGNVLLNRAIFAGDPQPFRPEFRAGEDQDFFQRKMEQGYRFVWSADAVVSELLPRGRWTRLYYVRKALLQGANAALQPDCGAESIAKSVVAVPLYAAALPFALLGGQHRFMTLLVKLCDHMGKLLGVMKIKPIREEYVSG